MIQSDRITIECITRDQTKYRPVHPSLTVGTTGMVELLLSRHDAHVTTCTDLLRRDEVIAVVDDSPEIVLLLTQYLKHQGLRTVTAGSGEELSQLLRSHRIALILLDIGLPDCKGNELLPLLAGQNPDLGIIMVTGTTDIETALDCLRNGADDYLTKPVSIKQFNYTVENTLKKRKLAIDNRVFQQELEKTNARMRFLHHLNLKMNTAYLNTVELRGILQAILVGITAEDGLRFNRAFMALFNADHTILEGKIAIGPSTREEAGRVWASMREEGLQLEDILEAIRSRSIKEDFEVNKIIQTLLVPASQTDHVLVCASKSKHTIIVNNGHVSGTGCIVPQDLIETLGETSFAVVPLYSPSTSLGVIIVDNFVTGSPITQEDIHALEIFASQASLAIEHSHLYTAMAEKITALEQTTLELERSKDLLVEAEKIAAIGEVSAQLLHGIRNPLTSIGGTARLLVKKTKDNYLANFLGIITQETTKIETILDDLFSFVEDQQLQLEQKPLFPLLRKSIMGYYSTMKRKNIDYSLQFSGSGPTLNLDEKKIRQALMHLLRNSIEAMNENGGNLIIQVQEQAQYIDVILQDTGSGIPEDALSQIKDPFFTTKTYGNGMGLTLVEQIIAQHGGSFAIHSAPDGGTVAILSLPRPT